jgi:protein-disulfide isomerase
MKRVILLATFLAFLAGSFAVARFRRRSRSGLDPAALEGQGFGVFKVPYELDDHFIGASDPKVTAVAFLDFACPFSARTYEELPAVVGDYPDEVRLVFRHRPILRDGQDRPAAHIAERAAHRATSGTSRPYCSPTMPT